MTIAVDTRCLAGNDYEGTGHFISNCFSFLAEKYPEHQFIYIFDKPFDQKFITSKNIVPVVTGPEAKTSLTLQYWYNFKVPAILKRHKANVFVSAESIALRTKVPQCFIIHDLAFVHYPQCYPKSLLRFYKKFIAKFLIKAKAIATVSEFSKRDIIERYAVDPGKIAVVYKSASSIFQPIDEKEKESIKEKYAEGKEFFLYSGAIDPGKNLMNILKAFSFFKKRQKSNMQLVIAGKTKPGYDQIAGGLKTFKFRNEVKLLEDLSQDQLTKITAGAYAMVCPVYVEDFTTPVMEAVQSGIPVILSPGTALPESVAAATLRADPKDFMDIANKMMMLVKDEAQRNELIGAGQAAVQQYDLSNTANLLWESISNAIE